MRKFLVHKPFAAEFLDFCNGIFGSEISNAPLVGDYSVALQEIVGAKHRVGVHLELYAKFAHRKYPVVFLPPAHQDLLAHIVGNLLVDSL